MSNEAHVLVEAVDMVYEAAERPLAALAGIDLAVRHGEFVSIIGPSGCGKSTLLRIVGGLQSPSRGRVLIDGRPPREAQRQKQIGFVFQDPSLLPWRSVIDNVRLPLLVNRRAAQGDNASTEGRRRIWRDALSPRPALRARRGGGGNRGRGRLTSRSLDPLPFTGTGPPSSINDPPSLGSAHLSQDPDRLVELVGLDAFRAYYPHQLSGGMQQRVALARSFVTGPSLLLMDEPFGALDEITRSAMRFELLRVWRSEAAERACTVVFVTHSIAEAVLLSDRIVVLTPQPGRVAAVLDVDLPRPRSEDLELDPAFLDYTRRLRALLRQRSLV